VSGSIFRSSWRARHEDEKERRLIMRIGFDTMTAAEKTADEQVKHTHVPGTAYTVSGPAEQLIHICGGGFFNEPRYYFDPAKESNAFKVLVSEGKVVAAPELTGQAKDVLEAAVAVANSDTPEDLLVIASWLRDTKEGLKLRTTPQMLLVLAAAHPKTRGFVRKYATSIIRRADEITQVFAAYRHLFQNGKPFHKGSFPHGLRKGLAEAFQAFSVFDLLKYDRDSRPSFKDVLLMISGSRKLPKRKKRVPFNHNDLQGAGATLRVTDHESGWPLSKPMFEYLVNRKIIDGAPEMLSARRDFAVLKSVDDITPELIRKAGLTWENIKSKAGQLDEDNDDVKLPAQVWELCVPIMGEMALVRNLRNLEQAKIPAALWDQVYEKLGKVENTVQLPFRFFAAEKQVTSTEAKTAVALLLDKACASLPDLSGRTVVLCDNSGSTQGATVSGNSEMRVADAGNTLAAVLAKRLGRRATVGVFGDCLMWVPFSQADSALTIKRTIEEYAKTKDRRTAGALACNFWKAGHGVGMGTETGLWWAMQDLIDRKEQVDRIIILSDLCCYTQGSPGACWYNASAEMARTFGANATIQSMIDRYRRMVKSDAYVYSVSLHGYKQAQTRPDDKYNRLLSGWSENVFRLISDAEAGEPTTAQQVVSEQGKKATPSVPTIELLRARYQK
jgi:hypothetical protein